MWARSTAAGRRSESEADRAGWGGDGGHHRVSRRALDRSGPARHSVHRRRRHRTGHLAGVATRVRRRGEEGLGWTRRRVARSARRREGLQAGGQLAPRGDARGDPPAPGRHQGAAHHARRRRDPLGQRIAAPAPRPLRLHPPRPLFRGRALAGARAPEARRRHLPRERRGRLCRHRVRGGHRSGEPRARFSRPGNGREDPRAQRHRGQADVQVRLAAPRGEGHPVRARQRPAFGHPRAQRQHHEVHRGGLPRLGLPGRPGALRRPHPARGTGGERHRGEDHHQGPHRRRHVPAGAVAPRRVLRHRHAESQRRLSLRRLRGPGGRPRHGARRQHRRRVRRLRGHPRHRAQVRRPGQGQSGQRDPLGRDAVRAPGMEGRGDGHHPRARGGHRRQAGNLRSSPPDAWRHRGLDLRLRRGDNPAPPMKSAIVTTPAGDLETPLLAVIVPAGTTVPASLAALERATGGVMARAIAGGDFKGKRDETQLLYPAAGKIQRLLIVGIGKSADVTRTSLRRAAAVAAKRARVLGAKSFALLVAAEARGGVKARDWGQLAVEGAAHGAWIFTDLKQAGEEPRVDVEAVDVVVDAKDAKEAEAGRRIGAAIAAGARYTRHLQMLPGNVCTPTYLADQAVALGKKHGVKVTVLDLAAIKKEGMGALLAVAQGSEQEPRFITLEYHGGGDGGPVVLVGKGVTFDSGGISIKPAQSMEDMKYDMSGAAAVLGAFEVLGTLKPKVDVIGVIPSTENLPSGTAIKPGDVVKSHLGKTIEIVNTDAEGRLILCDALSWARRYKPGAVLDAATLTGAVSIALGKEAIGLMGTDEALLGEVREAGERAGERCWPLPLWEEYRELVKSDIADVRNSGGRSAGTIAGGWFLREFVEGFPWAHLDIAGTAYTDSEGPHQVKGPTAIGVRLFSEFLLRRAGA